MGLVTNGNNSLKWYNIKSELKRIIIRVEVVSKGWQGSLIDHVIENELPRIRRYLQKPS